MVAEYLDKNYDRVRLFMSILTFPLWLTAWLPFPNQFFSSFTTLILSTNYVTKRQSLKLLGEILLDRANFNVMTRYIANEANLKMMMNLLRDKSKNIQFEAFHVFKVWFTPTIESLWRWRCWYFVFAHVGIRRKSEEAAANREHSATE